MEQREASVRGAERGFGETATMASSWSRIDSKPSRLTGGADGGDFDDAFPDQVR